MADAIVCAPAEMNSALSLVAAMARVQRGARMVLDMREVKWAAPAGLASMMASVHLHQRLGGDVVIWRPKEDGPANYLSRMRIGSEAGALGIDSDLPTVREDASLDGEALVPLTRFTGSEDIRDVLRILQARIGHEVLRTSMQKITSEAAINVDDHAQVGHGYVTAQVYPSTSRLKLAVADCGVGIHHTLAKRGAKTEREALRMAISGYSERETGGGEGLRTLVRELKSSRGHGELVSGRELINLVAGAAWRIPGGSFQGTIVSVDLPAVLDNSDQIFPSNHD